MHRRVILAILIILGLFVSISEGAITSREYPYLYKSPRAMGMGGVYIAIGGRTDTLFYNPAGLSTMPKEKGWEVNLLNPGFEIGRNVLNFVDDMQKAFDTGDIDRDGDPGDDQLRAVNDVMARYRGENLHLRITDLASMGKNFEPLAFGVGFLASLRFDGMTHQGFGPNGLIEINSNALVGGFGGVSYEVMEGLYLGAGLKYFNSESLTHSFTATELVEKQDTLEDYITKELKKSGNAFGVDVGAIYKYPEGSLLRPSVGLSIMNIGDLNFRDAGRIPMTVNLGGSVNLEIESPILKSLTIGADYVDIFNNYKEDRSISKRLRFGGEVVLLDKRLIGLALRTGVYEGGLTFGTDLRLLIFTFSYVTYAEEIGAYAGQHQDRRHLLVLNVGW